MAGSGDWLEWMMGHRGAGLEAGGWKKLGPNPNSLWLSPNQRHLAFFHVSKKPEIELLRIRFVESEYGLHVTFPPY